MNYTLQALKVGATLSFAGAGYLWLGPHMALFVIGIGLLFEAEEHYDDEDQ